MGRLLSLRVGLKTMNSSGFTAPCTTFSPQTVGPRHQGGMLKAGFGVDGEHDAGAGQVRAHHLLHTHGQGDGELVKPVDALGILVAVGDRPVGEQGSEALVAGFQHGLRPVDVEVGFLLTGKAGVGQILSSGRGTHGPRPDRC